MSTTHLAVLVLVAVLIVSGDVNAKSMRRVKKNQDKEMMCAMKTMSCMSHIMQLGGTTGEDMRQQILQNGLTGICTPLTLFSSCFSEVLNECDVPLGAEQLDGFQKMMKLTDFVCTKNFQAINADRQCLLGDGFLMAVNMQCGQPDLGAGCQITTQINCASNVYENICGNPSLATKLREFGRELAGENGCYQVMAMRSFIETLASRL